MKGLSSTHIPNDKYREGWDRIFGAKKLPANAVPVRHKSCGAIVMWYVGLPETNYLRSKDIILLDGTQPRAMSHIPLCPGCGERIVDPHQVKICFNEAKV